MKKISWQWLFYGMIILSLQANAQNSIQNNIKANTPPVIPVGLDAYRMWDQWPSQRIGARAYMRSTYDRRGGNEGVDASHFLFANEETFNVTLDVKGKGILYFFRANHWHGSPWHFVVDGKDNIVKESGTFYPVNAKKTIQNSEFIPSAPFPQPLNYTWATTKGADLIWTPMPFTESLRIAYSRTRYGTGYYIYHLYANEEQLSQPIRTWDLSQEPDKDVLELISQAGSDIAPKNIKKVSGKIKLNKQRILVENIKAPSSMIRAIKFTLPMERAIELERLRLQVTWDEASHPSVDAPLCLFFGAGTFYNRDDKEHLVKAFPVNIRYDYPNKKVELACYFPMPFYKSAKFELLGIKPEDSEINYEIRYEPLTQDKKLFSYFHATYKDMPVPEPGKDNVFLDTEGIEGSKDWSGHFVGTSYIFSHKGVLSTLEGDPRFFLDDSGTPNYGTGSEEWGGGGDYWGGETMTLPFAGHPVGCPDLRRRSFTKFGAAKNEKDLIQSAYRFLLADLMPFGRRAVIRFEHGGENLSTEHYEAVTYWYGVPSSALVLTDELNIGDTADEKKHNYHSPDASAVQSITSRYEWGIDRIPEIPERDTLPNHEKYVGKEVYPAHTEVGRYTRGVSEFKVALDPENIGAMLRRTLDYSFPNQTAEVYIADASVGQSGTNLKWELAGTWYVAGANTLIYSNPRGELDKRRLNIQISNRRFRDDEFLIPAKLTENRSSVWVRIKFIDNKQELFPGTPFPKDSAWSELRYKVFSYVIPEFFKK
jgi:hypothetical protein